MMLTLRQLADLVDGTLCGEGSIQIHGADIIRDARAGQITLADGDKALKQLAGCQASAVVIGKTSTPPAHLSTIQVDNVHVAFSKVVAAFQPIRATREVGVSPKAHISPSAKLGNNVHIYPGATIGADTEIADNCVIHASVVVMDGCRIGAGTVIFPGAVLYENTIVGEGCIIHAAAVLGAYGFGYHVVKGRHELSAQLGYVELGPCVEIGAGTTIDRGTYGATYIGEGTKIDNQVQVGHNVRLGKHNLICSQVGIAGSSTTGDYVVMAGQVGIRDHVHIGDGAQLGAKSGVMNDIPPGVQYVGAPAQPEREFFQSLISVSKLPEMRKQLKQLLRDVEGLQRSQGGGSLGRAEAA